MIPFNSQKDPPLAHLFLIDPQNGQIRMGRRPLDSERGRQWTLNVSATEGQGPRAVHAFTTVSFYVQKKMLLKFQ
jgi:hypothetical protein